MSLANKNLRHWSALTEGQTNDKIASRPSAALINENATSYAPFTHMDKDPSVRGQRILFYVCVHVYLCE